MTSAKPWSKALVALAVIACAGEDGVRGLNGSDGVSALVRVDAELPGSNCASGGVAVSTGLDANANGTLDAAEVSATTYVCNGAASLFATETLAAGDAHCPSGGVALHRGLDLDGDGVLDPGEVTGTDWVCNGAPAVVGLVAVTDEAPGTNCTAGGQAIRSGLDDNGDGLLQPAEVTSTAYVCNGTAGSGGPTSLVRQDDEPAGTHCTFGGKAISSGPDANGNGLLDAGEVSATTYVCNGAPGAAGATSLVNVTDEPAGTDCAAGGQKVETGVDANGNGVLDASEVQNTAYLCGSGPTRLYAVSAAQWGGVCPRGGVRVETGLDADADGVLDASEIDPAATQYVCNLYYAAIAPGASHTCAVVSDGTAVCWGRNGYGQLGDGTNVSRTAPVTVTGLAGVASLAAGGDHTCAGLTDGTVRCWGRNERGQLGDGGTTTSSVPVAVTGLSGVSSIAAGSYYTCAALADGTARCWGANNSGQLGDGTTTASVITPVEVSGILDATAITAGAAHTCARLTDGTVQCWGLNDYGQLGDGTTTSSNVPVTVAGISNAAAVAAGGSHSCAALGDGTVSCWGRNDFGQLGDSTTTSSPTPVAVLDISTAARVTAGGSHTCARLADGTGRCWGYGLYGRLGYGNYQDRAIPVAVSGISGASAIEAGGAHTCALLTDGAARCWGSNADGQLGNGTTAYSLYPMPVLGVP